MYIPINIPSYVVKLPKEKRDKMLNDNGTINWELIASDIDEQEIPPANRQALVNYLNDKYATEIPGLMEVEVIPRGVRVRDGGVETEWVVPEPVGITPVPKAPKEPRYPAPIDFSRRPKPDYFLEATEMPPKAPYYSTGFPTPAETRQAHRTAVSSLHSLSSLLKSCTFFFYLFGGGVALTLVLLYGLRVIVGAMVATVIIIISLGFVVPGNRKKGRKYVRTWWVILALLGTALLLSGDQTHAENTQNYVLPLSSYCANMDVITVREGVIKSQVVSQPYFSSQR